MVNSRSKCYTLKKYILLTFLIVCCCSAFSQISKGEWLAGGDASFSYNINTPDSQNDNKITNTTITLSPDIGYFLVDNLVIGARINFTNSVHHPKTQGLYYSEQQLSLSPFIRFYILNKEKKVNLIADVSYLYGRTRTHFPPDNNGNAGYTLNYKTAGYTVAAGPVFFLNPRVALEFTISYTNTDTKLYSPDYNSITIKGGAGLQIYMGK